MMTHLASQLEKLINGYLEQLNAVPDDDLSYKHSPGKWSKKEIIGHLVDSAQSNIRRFIIAQYEDNPSIVYNQDKWVVLNDYQHQDRNELIQLWYLLNKQACHILKNIPEENSQRTCQAGAVHTIEWLAQDYIKHLQHHMHVVLNLEPVAYP
jgi:hypothetical protein